jgi:hypothetical protein
MKQVRIHCVDCNRPVIVSTLQPCFYCGRVYKDDEIDELLQQNKAELVEVEKLLSAQGPLVVEPVAPTKSKPWKTLIYVAAVLFFLVLCMASVVLIIRFAK